MTDTMPTDSTPATTMPQDTAPVPDQGSPQPDGATPAEIPGVPPTDAGQALEATGAAPPEGGKPGHHDSIAEVVVGIAHDYMIPMSEESLTEWVHHLAEQKATPKEAHKIFQPYAAKIAEGLYPTLAPQIKSGIPVRLLLAPYTETAKSVLGPDVKPDYNDPAWGKALTGSVDPATNRPSAMSMDEWKKHLMTHPAFGFDKTPQAHAMVDHVLSGMQAEMNKPGGM